MPVFKPFKGIRPHEDYVQCFPTPAIDHFTKEEIAQKTENQHSYIKMVSPYVLGLFGNDKKNLQKVRSNFEEFIKNEKLLQDEESYYLYKQIFPDGNIFRGILGLASVEDFLNGKIKEHESTLAHKKEKFAKYLHKVNLQAEPVLLTYHSSSEIERMMDEEEASEPMNNCLDDRGIKHQIWRITDQKKIQTLAEVLTNINAFYIADGHHRMGSTAINFERKKGVNSYHNGDETYNFIYSFIVSDQSIKIHDYNRLIKDLKSLSSVEFIEKLKEDFEVTCLGSEACFPKGKSNISMYFEGCFYNLRIKKSNIGSLENLDHYVLEQQILTPILGIEDSKTTKEIHYLKGNSSIDGVLAIKEKVDSGEFKVGFVLYPVEFEHLLSIADKQLKMPPKCTYIEPKPITALVMYDMK